MDNYTFSSFWLKPQAFRTTRPSHIAPEFAAYLARINQSAGPRTWPLRTLPRLKGASTHVIVTQYDLPDRVIQPHDVVGLPDGSLWYSDFGQQFLGRLDPKTGAVTQFPMPEMKPGYLTGSLDLESDPAGNLWLGNLFQGGIVRFNTKTRTFDTFPVTPTTHPDLTQSSMVAAAHMSVDGKIWTNDQDDHTFRRLDPVSGTWQTFGPFESAPGKTFEAYGIASDAANGLWVFDFAPTANAIGHLDPKTGAFRVVTTPSSPSRARRGRFDDRTGRLWFAEFAANRIGMYDTVADDGTVKEFLLPTPWDSPYDVVSDKNGFVWTGSMLSDRISRLDSATGNVLDYELPFRTNIRRVWIDNSTSPVTLWVGSNHDAAIVKLQTLP